MMNQQEQDDTLKAHTDILRKHREDLDALKAELARIWNFVNSSETLLRLARGPRSERGEKAKAETA